MPSNSGKLPGNEQPPQTLVADPCSEANATALEEAKAQQDKPKKGRPVAASGLRASSGQAAAGHSGGGSISAVDSLARTFPDLDNNHYGCAELNCISNAMSQGVDVKGSVIVTVEVRGRNSPTGAHGTKKPACAVCSKVLEALDIEEC